MIRTPRRVRQRMYYALPTGLQPIYEKDDEGNIVYIIMGGEKIPKEIGEPREGYTEPVSFFNSITGTLTEDELQAFGNKDRGNAKMTYHPHEYPFKAGTLIWKDSKVKHDDFGMIDPESADFVVVGIMTEGQHFWRCILTAVAKDHEDQPDTI